MSLLASTLNEISGLVTSHSLLGTLLEFLEEKVNLALYYLIYFYLSNYSRIFLDSLDFYHSIQSLLLSTPCLLVSLPISSISFKDESNMLRPKDFAI
jgi:hypothetical protein